MSRKTASLVIFFLVLGLYWIWPRSSVKTERVNAPAVTIVKAQVHHFTDRLFVSGSLSPREEVLVAPKIGDLTIAEIDAEDGDHVVQGQILAKLDRSQLDAQLAQNDAARARAQATIDQAKSNVDQAKSQSEYATSEYARAQKLAKGVMADSLVEQRLSNMQAAQAALAATKQALSVAQADLQARDADRFELSVRIEHTNVRAPVAGLISRRTARLGATASPNGDPLFRIIKDKALDLVADVPEQWLARLQIGMKASLHLPGLDAPVTGIIRLVDQEVDKASRTGKVRILLTDVAHAHSGAFAYGEVDIFQRDGISAPTTAVKREGNSGAVLVVEGDIVQARPVTLGITEGESVEIVSGITAGEALVARAASFLRAGDRVLPILSAGP